MLWTISRAQAVISSIVPGPPYIGISLDTSQADDGRVAPEPPGYFRGEPGLLATIQTSR